MVPPFLTKWAWQIGGGVAAVALLVTAGLLVAAQVENRRITEVNRVLDDRITNPSTGYVAKLAQAQTNTETLKVSLEGQVKRLKEAAAVDARRLAETEAKLKAAQAQSAVIRRQVAALTARQPQGDTLDARVLDVDAKVLEMLK